MLRSRKKDRLRQASDGHAKLVVLLFGLDTPPLLLQDQSRVLLLPCVAALDCREHLASRLRRGKGSPTTAALEVEQTKNV